MKPFVGSPYIEGVNGDLRMRTKRLGPGAAVDKTHPDTGSKGNDMAADTNPQAGESHIRTHNKDYAKFTNMLKWSTLAVAIIAAVVIYIISN